MKILDHEISEQVEYIINDINKKISLPVVFNYTNDETSSAHMNISHYFINLTNDFGLSFEYNLAHEYCHLLQFEHHFPMIKISNTMSDENKNLLTTIQNIVLDKEVEQTLHSYQYYNDETKNTKYNTYYPIFKKIRKYMPDMEELHIKQYALEISFIYLFDSKIHAENMLKCTDIKTYNIRKLTYAIVDCFNHYPEINHDNISSLYEELIGCFNISKTEYKIMEYRPETNSN